MGTAQVAFAGDCDDCDREPEPDMKGRSFPVFFQELL